MQGQGTWKTNGKSKLHMARIIVNIDVTTAVARRAHVLFRYQLDIRKSEPGHSDETNQFLTELEHDTKPDNSPHGDRTRQAQASGHCVVLMGTSENK